MRKTTEQFIKEAKLIHGDKYDYSETEYKNNKTKVKVFCKRCNEYFEQRPDAHLKSYGHICYKKEILSELRKCNTIEFIKKAEKKFPNKYKYDKVNYINSTTKTSFFL